MAKVPTAKARGKLVGQCRACGCVFYPYRQGETCPCEGRKVVRRRMHHCVVCGGFYPTHEALIVHQHYDYE